MTNRTAFHLDCSSNLQECGCKCEKCIEEMETIFAKTQGVSKFYREGGGVVVEHNASIVTADQLMEIFKGLPSFYEGFFVPSIMEDPESQS